MSGCNRYVDMNLAATPPLISVVIPVFNGRHLLSRCLQALAASDYPAVECVVVDDGSTDGSTAVAQGMADKLRLQLLTVPAGPRGPALARNLGAQAAQGEYLFFIDADVVVRPETVRLVAQTFQQNPEYAALFGSYDDIPAEAGFLSQYRNLQHHFVHQQGATEASTFWSGCGAIRRTLFLELGGFDVIRYPRPSIEDIDLGYRLRQQGERILLNKQIQVKHLKTWTLKGMLRTDIFDRAIPWSRLIVQARNLPNDLNLQSSQRVSAALAGMLVLFLVANLWQPGVGLLWLWLGLFLTLVDGWRWQEAGAVLPYRFIFSRYTLSFLLLSGVGSWLVSEYTGTLPGIAILSALLLMVGVVGQLWADKSAFWRDFSFSAMMVATGMGFIWLLIGLPWWFSLPVLLILVLVVGLNRPFYFFFWQQRGVAFALATLPLQLLYYLYSLVSFVFVTIGHLWETNTKRKSVVESLK